MPRSSFAVVSALLLVALAALAAACGPSADACHHDLPSGTYVHKFDMIEKQMVVDRAAHTVTISYDKGDGKIVVEHWRINE